MRPIKLFFAAGGLLAAALFASPGQARPKPAKIVPGPPPPSSEQLLSRAKLGVNKVLGSAKLTPDDLSALRVAAIDIAELERRRASRIRRTQLRPVDGGRGVSEAVRAVFAEGIDALANDGTRSAYSCKTAEEPGQVDACTCVGAADCVKLGDSGECVKKSLNCGDDGCGCVWDH